MRVGFIGLGNVGGKLSGSLLRNGSELAVNDLNPELVARFVERGAIAGGSAAQLMQSCDVVLKAENLRDGTSFPDGCVPCTWGIDTHFPHSSYLKGFEDEPFIADYTRGEGYVYDGPYWLPYRCLYSRSIDNLFMAGRNISVTHEALGAVRVMKTTGTMGEIVGMAAAICREQDCLPRDVHGEHLERLKALMSTGAGRVESQ